MMNYVRKLWYGDERLWITYWIVYVLGGVSFDIISELLRLFVWRGVETTEQVLVATVLFRISLLWCAFSLVAVMRSAKKYKGKYWINAVTQIVVMLGFLKVCFQMVVMVVALMK